MIGSLVDQRIVNDEIRELLLFYYKEYVLEKTICSPETTFLPCRVALGTAFVRRRCQRVLHAERCWAGVRGCNTSVHAGPPVRFRLVYPFLMKI